MKILTRPFSSGGRANVEGVNGEWRNLTDWSVLARFTFLCSSLLFWIWSPDGFFLSQCEYDGGSTYKSGSIDCHHHHGCCARWFDHEGWHRSSWGDCPIERYSSMLILFFFQLPNAVPRDWRSSSSLRILWSIVSTSLLSKWVKCVLRLERMVSAEVTRILNLITWRWSPLVNGFGCHPKR